MVEKGKKDKNRRESQKNKKLSLKEKRKIKKGEKSVGDVFDKIRNSAS